MVGKPKLRVCAGSGEGTSIREVARNFQKRGGGAIDQVWKSHSAPPKEVESEGEMDLAEVTQPVLGIKIYPLAFLRIQDHQSKKH